MKQKYSFLETLLFGIFKEPKTKHLQSLENKTILITGATHGIGEALAFQLSHINCKLILIGRTEEKLQQFSSKKAQITTYKCDLTNHKELSNLIKKIGKKNIEFFINNAGRSMKRKITDSQPNDADKVMNLHYNAPTTLITSLIPNIKSATIINSTSASILFPPTKKWGAYNASKIAFTHWLNTLQLETKSFTIKQLYLPLVNTRMIPTHSAYANFPKMDTVHVANKIIRLMTTNKTTYKPWWLSSSAFLLRTFPFVWKLIAKIGQ